MIKEKIIENNVLIAEFMNYKHPNPHNHWKWEVEGKTWANEGLAFDRSWDWLMPICEKIRSLGSIDFIVSIGGSVVISWDDGTAYYEQTMGHGRDTIETTYEAVVKFIKWYNENKPEK